MRPVTEPPSLGEWREQAQALIQRHMGADKGLNLFTGHLGLIAASAPAQEGWRYRNYQHLVLDLSDGPQWAKVELPEEIAYMEAQQCFRNAWELALENPGLTYVEGYALKLIPTEHAWVERADGTIIDPTWANPIHNNDDDTKAMYMGVRFHLDFLIERAERTGYPSVFGGDTFTTNHEVLKRGLRMHDGMAIDLEEGM